MMIKRYLPELVSAAILCSLMFVPSCANTTDAPSGGPKDSIPPYIVDIKPLPGLTRFPTEAGTKVEFVFDEYVVIKEQNNILLSPPLAKKPKAKIKNKSLMVTFEDGLAENTTYTINLQNAIADNNEGNYFPGYTYAFSTGDRIDSMMLTGSVYDCTTLKPAKDATVMLYKNHADSAVFNELPYATAKTDDWGFFYFSYIPDTLYRLYAITDDNNNFKYDPGTESVAFADDLIRPSKVVSDTIPELMKYDMKDTVACLARVAEHKLYLFREISANQSIVKKERVSKWASYVTFFSRFAWIDSLWVQGLDPSHIITQFNLQQDSLEVWFNDPVRIPDTLNLFIQYRKTDTLGKLTPAIDKVKLINPDARKKPESREERTHADSICRMSVSVTPENVEQDGFDIGFALPIVRENMDSIQFYSLNPKMIRAEEPFRIERDSLNILHYKVFPEGKMYKGYEYYLHIPQGCFMDLTGYVSDSTDVKVTLPTDEKLSTLVLDVAGVDGKYLVDLMDKARSKVYRSYIIDSDRTLTFPYLQAGEYCIRFISDRNGNSLVDSGVLLEHKQPESVFFYKYAGKEEIAVPASSELSQSVNLSTLL